MITIEQMVQREVNCCLSSLVSTLAQGCGLFPAGRENAELRDLVEQAFELACPVPDYEEALFQAGWRLATKAERDAGFCCWQLPPSSDDGDSGDQSDKSPDTICQIYDIEPYDREVYEHWSVSTWFAEKLLEQGEKVDTDFAGMNVWARTCTGQGIASDGVIERIYNTLVAS